MVGMMRRWLAAFRRIEGFKTHRTDDLHMRRRGVQKTKISTSAVENDRKHDDLAKWDPWV